MHGECIETDHRLFCTLAPGLGDHFVLPESSVERSHLIRPDLDKDRYTDEGLSTSALRIRWPAASDPRRRATESQYSAVFDRMVQGRHDGGSGDGFPAFNMEGPAPTIARAQEYDTFFGGPFVIWTVDGKSSDGKVCRLVRRNELLYLFGLGRYTILHLLQAP